MQKYYFAPVFGTDHQLLRYAGATVEATGPEGASRLKPGEEKGKMPCSKNGKLSPKEKKMRELKPLDTGRSAAFEAIRKSLSKGERVAKRSLRSIG